MHVVNQAKLFDAIFALYDVRKVNGPAPSDPELTVGDGTRGHMRVAKLRKCIKYGQNLRTAFPRTEIPLLCMQEIIDIAKYAPVATLAMLDSVERQREQLLKSTSKSKSALDKYRTGTALRVKQYLARIKLGMEIKLVKRRLELHNINYAFTTLERNAVKAKLKEELRKEHRELALKYMQEDGSKYFEALSKVVKESTEKAEKELRMLKESQKYLNLANKVSPGKLAALQNRFK